MLARFAVVASLGVGWFLAVSVTSAVAFAAPKSNAVPAANRVNARDQPLFDALCGKGNDAWVSGTHGCVRCPAYTSAGAAEPPTPLAAGEKPTLVAWPEFQMSGSFTRRGTRQQLVVLAAAACEGHADNWGGSVLLERGAGAPSIVEYDRGFAPLSCKPHPVAEGHSALLCEAVFAQGGIVQESLIVRDFAEPWDDRVDHALFTLESDETSVCTTASDADQGPFLMSTLKDYGWADTNHDGRADAIATIQFASFPIAAPLKKHCADLDAFWATTHKTAQLVFEADANDQLSPNDSTKVTLRESAGLNTGAP